MKKKTKIIFILSLCVVLVIGVAIGIIALINKPDAPAHTHSYTTVKYDNDYHWNECECGKRDTAENHKYTNYKSDSAKSWYECDCGARDNSRFYFGSYPQREVTESTTTSALLTKAGNPKTSTSGWISYNYYIKEVQTDCMYYKDVELNGEKYRGVYIKKYRPIGSLSNEENSHQDNNGYNTNSVYWFKYEPIEWSIVQESNGYVTIVCNMILDSQAYQDTYTYSNGEYCNNSTGTPSGIYANNYKYSTIRKWLNETFYQTAFNSLQQAIIQTVEVDNSLESTGDVENKYVCENTFDKVWLLSYEETTTYFTTDAERYRKNTAYAQIQGAYTATDTSWLDNGHWWLRSPFYYTCYDAKLVYCYGYVYSSYYFNHGVSGACYGIVPTLKIRL